MTPAAWAVIGPVLISSAVTLLVVYLTRRWKVTDSLQSGDSRLRIGELKAAAEFRDQILAEITRLQDRIRYLEEQLDLSRDRERALEATLDDERQGWSIQRSQLERRVHSLERCVREAGLEVPKVTDGAA